MSTQTFREARDLLIDLRQDHLAAREAFRWPDLDVFNWAIDWFDAELAQGSSASRLALKIVGEQAAERTFAQLAQASNRVANGLRAQGLRRGDRLLLMLGNRAELWEAMLAAMKLGVVIIPASTLLTAEDIAARIVQADIRAVITEAELTKSAALRAARSPRTRRPTLSRRHTRVSLNKNRGSK